MEGKKQVHTNVVGRTVKPGPQTRPWMWFLKPEWKDEDKREHACASYQEACTLKPEWCSCEEAEIVAAWVQDGDLIAVLRNTVTGETMNQPLKNVLLS